MKIRQAAAVAAGLALAASFGLAGGGAASAASPALHVGGKYPLWTLEVKGAGCEVYQFQTEPQEAFFGDHGDVGLWSGGEAKIIMYFQDNPDHNPIFTGHFDSSTTPVEYNGSLSQSSGSHKSAKLVRGSVSAWHGSSC